LYQVDGNPGNGEVVAYRLLGSSADVEVLDVTTDETFYGNISDSNVVRYGTGFYFPFSNDRPLAYGATGTGSIVAVSGTATPATATGSHTIADGDNLVIASVGMGLTTSGATTVGAFTVTYGGVPMTPVGSLATATLATSTKGQVQQFYLLDPPSGPQATTVSATFTSNANAAHRLCSSTRSPIAALEHPRVPSRPAAPPPHRTGLRLDRSQLAIWRTSRITSGPRRPTH
jgi:hypothetical protein